MINNFLDAFNSCIVMPIHINAKLAMFRMCILKEHRSAQEYFMSPSCIQWEACNAELAITYRQFSNSMFVLVVATRSGRQSSTEYDRTDIEHYFVLQEPIVTFYNCAYKQSNSVYKPCIFDFQEKTTVSQDLKIYHWFQTTHVVYQMKGKAIQIVNDIDLSFLGQIVFEVKKYSQFSKTFLEILITHKLKRGGGGNVLFPFMVDSLSVPKNVKC